MTPILAFDLETVPDVAGIRRLNGLPADLPDADVAEGYAQARRAQTGSDFPQHYLHKVVAIACALRRPDGIKVWSVGERDEGEADLIRRFFEGVEKFTPQLVSWNGGGFDLPVLQQRGLRHGVVAGRYWDMGDDDREHRYNNYISRYHLRHIDLMDLLAMYQSRANAPLDAMAKLCGFPGKLGMDGSQVYSAYLDGRRDEIRRYCETDAMNTYLLWCRFEKMRGRLDDTSYRREIGMARDAVAAIGEPHWAEYLAAWPVEESRAGADLRRGAPTPVDSAAMPTEESTAAAPVAIVETTTETTTTETTIYIDSSSIRA